MTNPTISAESRAKLALSDGHKIRAWGAEHLVAEQIREAEQAAYERAAQACEAKLGDAQDSVTGRTLQRMFDEMASDIRDLAQEPEKVG